MDLVDNSQLEELMKINVNEAGADEQEKFLEKFAESQLIMPVEYSANVFEGLENANVGDVFEPEEQAGFNIIYLTDDEGRNAVPLFTSPEMMERAGINSSTYVLFMSDLADLMKQAGDKYSLIAVNPFTDLNINMPMGLFLSLFRDTQDLSNTLGEVLKIIEKHSAVIGQNTSLMIHSDENFMKDLAEEGIFRSPVPLNINSDPHFNEELKYTFILLFDKTKKLLYLGSDFPGDFDTIVAPETEFEFVKDLDEFTSVWKCGAQHFFE